VLGDQSDPAVADALRTLAIWVYKGSHRIDKNKDGNYDEERAVQIMDAWWPRAVRAIFEPSLGTSLFDKIAGFVTLDNEPNNHGAHLGSAWQDGWYGYVNKDLRRILGQPVQGQFSRTYCGNGVLAQCRAALLSSLQAALQVPKEQLWQTAGCTNGDETCFDAVRFRAIGAITVPELPWINRPTYQQVVQVNGHRPR
jgi:hypothetical protein